MQRFLKNKPSILKKSLTANGQSTPEKMYAGTVTAIFIKTLNY
jgi:hypothetical protein